MNCSEVGLFMLGTSDQREGCPGEGKCRGMSKWDVEGDLDGDVEVDCPGENEQSRGNSLDPIWADQHADHVTSYNMEKQS